MADGSLLPRLPEDWEPTRATLHAYARAITAIPRAMAPQHPKWWHASLVIRPTGLTSDVVPLPNGGTAQFRLDLAHHMALLDSSDGQRSEWRLTDGATATEMGDALLNAARRLGLDAIVERDRFESDEPREYEEGHAETVWTVLTNVSMIMEGVRRSLDPVGPVQLWPHGFDVSFEWFGTKVVQHTESGQVADLASQINFGFYPADEAYFYANPWPFDTELTKHELTPDAEWHDATYEGTMLPYSRLADEPDAGVRLSEYWSRVFEVASPALTA